MSQQVKNIAPSNALSEEAEITLGLLGVVIADQPEQVRKLLREFRIDTSNKPTARELTNKVIYAIDTRGKEFHWELAKILSAQLPPQDEYNSYEGEEQEDGYVNLIMGAIGGIGNAIGSIKGKKEKRAEASQKTMSTIMAYKAQQQQIEAQKVAQQQAHANNMKLLKGIGILVVVVGVGWIAFRQFKQPKPKPQTALTK